MKSDKITHLLSDDLYDFLLSDDLYDFVSFLEFYIGHCLNNEETPDSNAFEELLEKIEILASSMVELTEKLKLDQIKPPGLQGVLLSLVFLISSQDLVFVPLLGFEPPYFILIISSMAADL